MARKNIIISLSCLFAIILGGFIFFVSIPPKSSDFSQNQDFIGIFVNPETDCSECVLKGISLLSTISDNLDRFIIYKKTNPDFMQFLKNEIQRNGIGYKYEEKDLKIPHPSILIVQNGKITSYIYLSAEQYKRAKLFELLNSFINQPTNNGEIFSLN